MNLFKIQKCTAVESVTDAGTSEAEFHTTYIPAGSPIVFEDNPGVADLWSVPRRQEHIYTMNLGGVNIDLGVDRSKQDMKMTLNVVTQKFYNDIMKWYLYDENDTMYILTSHRNENWVVKWKDITPKYLGTLPPEFKDSVPLPDGMTISTPFEEYADVYELQISFLVVDHNVNV